MRGPYWEQTSFQRSPELPSPRVLQRLAAGPGYVAAPLPLWDETPWHRPCLQGKHLQPQANLSLPISLPCRSCTPGSLIKQPPYLPGAEEGLAGAESPPVPGLPEVGLRMSWHSSKEEPQLLCLFNGGTTFNRLLQKGSTLVLLWDAGEELPYLD